MRLIGLLSQSLSPSDSGTSDYSFSTKDVLDGSIVSNNVL